MTSVYGADAPSIKVESAQHAANGQDVRVKPDPDNLGASPGPQLEDDIYEDAGDLDFAGAEQGFYLTKLPNFLWDSLSKLDAKQEIQVGTIRVEGDMDNIKRMSLFLTPQAATIHQLPREYNMPIIEQDSINTFVFSEKDLPGHKKYTPGRAPPRSQDRRKVEKPRAPGKPFTRFIPRIEQTSLSGHIQSEFNCLPVENKEFQQYSLRENNRREAQKPKIKPWLGGDVVIDGEPTNYFDGLISNTQTMRKKNKEKTARIAQNELMDLIFDCFKDFKYWTLASLRARLRQPESFLKETLEKIAILMRAGTMTGKYQLKPEYTNTDAGTFDNVKAEAAPDMDPSVLGMAEDDEDEEMEDVLI